MISIFKFLLQTFAFKNWHGGFGALGEFPPRDPLPIWLRLHIIYRLLLVSVLDFIGFPSADQALREGILVNVVLVVEFGHGEATHSLAS